MSRLPELIHINENLARSSGMLNAFPEKNPLYLFFLAQFCLTEELNLDIRVYLIIDINSC